MIDNEDLKDIYTRLKLANGVGRDLGVMPNPQVLWWASYYRGDVQALLAELQLLDDSLRDYGSDVKVLLEERERLEDVLRDILSVVGGWCRPMKDDAERLRVIQDISYDTLGIRGSKGRSKEAQE